MEKDEVGAEECDGRTHVILKRFDNLRDQLSFSFLVAVRLVPKYCLIGYMLMMLLQRKGSLGRYIQCL